MAPLQLAKKICLLGDLAVGKTSLVRRFVIDKFEDTYLTTIGVKITKKELLLYLGQPEPQVAMKLMLWDIAGHHTFSNVKSAYYRGSDGALIVCDLTRQVTLANVAEWCRTLKQVSGERPMILLANKSDLTDKFQYGQEEVEAMCKSLGITYLLTSAKSGKNVELAFRMLSKLIVKSHQESLGR